MCSAFGAPPGYGSASGHSSDPSAGWQAPPSTLEEFVRAVKTLCRDSDAKDQWHAFTDAYDPAGRSTRNPERHTLEFLKSFHDQWTKGMRFRSNDSALGLTKLTRGGTKATNFKQQWEEYCGKCGNGINDPTKHASKFHLNFLDYIAQRSATLAEMEKESNKAIIDAPIGEDLDGDEDPAAKRLRTGPTGLTLPMGMMGLDLGARAKIAADMGLLMQQDPEKEALVRRVKDYQRKGKAEGEVWYEWCGSKRDPNRHTSDRLKEFCNKYCIQENDS